VSVSDRVVLVARYTVKPGNVDTVLDALRRMQPLVAQHEPGCLVYHVNRSQDDPNLLLLYEEYTDHAALEAHTGTPHFKEIIIGTVIPLLARREREFYAAIHR
jgi:quinol monooxygenase YgiN